MKKGKKYITRTIWAVNIAIVLSIGTARALKDSAPRYEPQRMGTDELSQLEDFTSIDIIGNFALEIDYQSGFSIEYSPLESLYGTFSASVTDSVLTVTGHNSQDVNEMGEMRIGMPHLTSLTGRRLTELNINGFRQSTLSLNTVYVRSITLTDTTLDTFEATLQIINTLDLRNAEIGSKSLQFSNLRDGGLNLLE